MLKSESEDHPRGLLSSEPEPCTLKLLTGAVATPSWQLQLSSPESGSLMAIMYCLPWGAIHSATNTKRSTQKVN